MSHDPSHALFHGKCCHSALSLPRINSKLLLYGKRLLGIKTDKHLCRYVYFSVTRSGITYVAPNEQDQSDFFKIFLSHKPVGEIARNQSIIIFI